MAFFNFRIVFGLASEISTGAKIPKEALGTLNQCKRCIVATCGTRPAAKSLTLLGVRGSSAAIQ